MKGTQDMATNENETQGTDATLTLPLKVLSAINRFAYKQMAASMAYGEEYRAQDRPHLAGVHVTPTYLAATDGHRLVRVRIAPPWFVQSTGERPAPYTIPSWLIDAAESVAESMGVSEHTSVTIHRPLKVGAPMVGVVISSPGDSVRAAVVSGKVTTGHFPPIEQVMSEVIEGIRPPKDLCFNPALLADCGAVLDALGCKYGVKIIGWGDLRSPLQLEAEDVRFVVMPMKGPDL